MFTGCLLRRGPRARDEGVAEPDERPLRREDGLDDARAGRGNGKEERSDLQEA
jgi:hypothetical protein